MCHSEEHIHFVQCKLREEESVLYMAGTDSSLRSE